MATIEHEPGLFPDVDFTNAIHELDNPDLNGWDFFVESKGVTIYRQYNEVIFVVCWIFDFS